MNTSDQVYRDMDLIDSELTHIDELLKEIGTAIESKKKAPTTEQQTPETETK